MVEIFGYILAQFSDILSKNPAIQMKLVEIYSNKSCSNQVLRKLVKPHNSQNVNIQLYQRFKALKSLPHGCFFLCFLQKFVLFIFKMLIDDFSRR